MSVSVASKGTNEVREDESESISDFDFDASLELEAIGVTILGVRTAAECLNTKIRSKITTAKTAAAEAITTADLDFISRTITDIKSYYKLGKIKSFFILKKTSHQK